MFGAMRFENNCLFVLDQKQLPSQEYWLQCRDLESVAQAIESMAIRGAPAIGCSAAWGLVLDAFNHLGDKTWANYQAQSQKSIERMRRTRPTAVNLFYAISSMAATFDQFHGSTPMQEVYKQLHQKAQQLFDDDIKTCERIGRHGANLITKPSNVLTHCNTGSLATAGYGTALGIIRSMHSNNLIKNVWVDETRPYLQGSRLTAFELQQDKIPFKLICDNMAGYLMQLGQVDLVVVGADRIAANGDTANKIGTYSLAVLCHHHKIPFVVAAPKATIDTSIESGRKIKIEERPGMELTMIQNNNIAPLNTEVWNPSFDVTPGELIYAIVTEDGVALGPNFSL